jgi:hypothetical protein
VFETFTNLITHFDGSLILTVCLVQECLLLLQEYVETGEVSLQIRVTFSFE